MLLLFAVAVMDLRWVVALTVLFGLLVEQVGRGGAADLLHDNLNNRERAALAGESPIHRSGFLLADGRD